jgi:hypothetical protein
VHVPGAADPRSPPKNLREAAAFAASHGARDRAAIEVLGKRPKESAQHTAACVRALGLIGGAIALDVLATYRTTGGEGRFVNARGHRLGRPGARDGGRGRRWTRPRALIYLRA